VKLLKRIVSILDRFSNHRTSLSLGELVQETGLPKPTVYRLCEALVEEGMLIKRDDGRYVLGTKLLGYGAIALTSNEIRRIAAPEIQELHAITRETVHLGILSDKEIISIEALESPHGLRATRWVGQRAPLHSTAVGKALLAFLPHSERERLIEELELRRYTENTITSREKLQKELDEIRSRGYAIDNMENEEGVRCVAAPIFGLNGRIVASISISGPAFRLTSQRLQEYASLVMDAAKKISRKMQMSI